VTKPATLVTTATYAKNATKNILIAKKISALDNAMLVISKTRKI